MALEALCDYALYKSTFTLHYITHNALRYHWLMPVSCHFRDCKALLVTRLTHVSGAIASVQTFTFTSSSLVTLVLQIDFLGEFYHFQNVYFRAMQYKRKNWKLYASENLFVANDSASGYGWVILTTQLECACAVSRDLYVGCQIQPNYLESPLLTCIFTMQLLRWSYAVMDSS